MEKQHVSLASFVHQNDTIYIFFISLNSGKSAAVIRDLSKIEYPPQTCQLGQLLNFDDFFKQIGTELHFLLASAQTRPRKPSKFEEMAEAKHVVSSLKCVIATIPCQRFSQRNL